MKICVAILYNVKYMTKMLFARVIYCITLCKHSFGLEGENGVKLPDFSTWCDVRYPDMDKGGEFFCELSEIEFVLSAVIPAWALAIPIIWGLQRLLSH